MQISPGHALAWLAVTVAFSLHILDEALNDFLSVYNPTVAGLRHRLPFLPLPTFTFPVWLTGLLLANGILYALTPLVRRGSPGALAFSRVYGAVMLVNGLQHIGFSIYLGRPMPGVSTSPLLIASSLFLLDAVRRGRPAPVADPPGPEPS